MPMTENDEGIDKYKYIKPVEEEREVMPRAKDGSLQNPYNMCLHEIHPANGSWRVKRVPGGWLYFTQTHPHPVFVPYSPEFLNEFENVIEGNRD